MKKRIALALSMILMVLLLGACGTDPTTVDYNGHSYEDLQSESDNNVTMVQQLAAMFEENSLTVDTVTQDIVDALSNNYGVTQAQIEAAGKWMDVTDEFGAFEKVKDLTLNLSMIENSAYRLAAAIKKTQKRANALKNITIPHYTQLSKDIADALEEKEREEFTRLKVIKQRKNKAS